MSHRCGPYLTSLILPSRDHKVLSSRNFANSENSHALAYLREDAIDYIYNAILSMCDAISGFRNGFYSWGVVKLYYSCFYSMRATLALNGVAIGYLGCRPFRYIAHSGGHAGMTSGNTHEVVYSVFKSVFPNHPLVNSIEGISAYEWMKGKREIVNYNNAAFSEPIIPNFMPFSDELEMKNSLISYIKDNQYVYLFDADHAIMAFPIACIKAALSTMHSSNLKLMGERFDFLNSICTDNYMGLIFSKSR